MLKNHAKHGIGLVGLDPYAPGKWFDGWRTAKVIREPAPHLARAKTWLLNVGWKRWGLVDLTEAPAYA